LLEVLPSYAHLRRSTRRCAFRSCYRLAIGSAIGPRWYAPPRSRARAWKESATWAEIRHATRSSPQARCLSWFQCVYLAPSPLARQQQRLVVLPLLHLFCHHQV